MAITERPMAWANEQRFLPEGYEHLSVDDSSIIEPL
jgi:hypothetical protein